MKRKIITKKRFDELMDKDIINRFINEYGTECYGISFADKAEALYTPETVGKQEERDYNLTAIELTCIMKSIYLHTEGLTVNVDDGENPYESSKDFFVPEWMFEDRQLDLDNLAIKYGRIV